MGGVTGSLEPSCNSFLQFWGKEERMLLLLQKLHIFTLNLLQEELKRKKWPSQESKRSEICFIPA